MTHLPFAQRKPSTLAATAAQRSTSGWRSLGYLMLLTVMGVGLWAAARWLLVDQTQAAVTGFFRDTLGLPAHTSRAAGWVGALTAACVGLATVAKWAIGRPSRALGVIAFLAVCAVWGLEARWGAPLMPDGQPRQRFAIVDGRCRYFDLQRTIDPATGAALSLATPDAVARCNRLKAGQEPHEIELHAVEGVHWFDAGTGLPRMYFARRADGELAFFDGEGFDPATGAALQPITAAVVADARRQFDRLPTIARPSSGTAAPLPDVLRPLPVPEFAGPQIVRAWRQPVAAQTAPLTPMARPEPPARPSPSASAKENIEASNPRSMGHAAISRSPTAPQEKAWMWIELPRGLPTPSLLAVEQHLGLRAQDVIPADRAFGVQVAMRRAGGTLTHAMVESLQSAGLSQIVLASVQMRESSEASLGGFVSLHLDWHLSSYDLLNGTVRSERRGTSTGGGFTTEDAMAQAVHSLRDSKAPTLH